VSLSSPAPKKLQVAEPDAIEAEPSLCSIRKLPLPGQGLSSLRLHPLPAPVGPLLEASAGQLPLAWSPHL
jgi:hypothetical protein